MSKPAHDPDLLELVLHGTFSVRHGATSIDTLSRRGQAMLAYLANQSGMRAERAFLADLLWSDRSEEQARASLRQELSVLRRTLPEGVLDANRQHVWLMPARVGIVSGKGTFLQGFDLASEGFEDWLRVMRSGDDGLGALTDPATHPRSRPSQPRVRPTLAVLPFEELGAAETDMFADGVVEEITGALSRAHDIHVIARQSAFALRGERLDVPETAKRLGADYVVEGSVRRSGDRVRITVQLVNGSDGHTLWSERFDDRLDDLFDLQDRIAGLVAGQLSPNLRAAEIARIHGTRPESRSAYETLLAAMPFFWSHSRAGNQQALLRINRALEIEPTYGYALAMRAWCLSQEHVYMYTDDPVRARLLAVEAIEEAAPLAGNHAPSLTALSASVSISTFDTERASFYADRAIELDPNNAWAWMRRGWNEAFPGHVDACEAALDRAEALSPVDPFRFNMILARAILNYHWLGQDGGRKAIGLMREAMRLNPEAKWINRALVGAAVVAGDEKAATDAARDLIQAYPHLTVEYLRNALPQSQHGLRKDYFAAFEAVGIPQR